MKPFFAGHKMAAITIDLVRRYATERRDKSAAHASVNRELALLKLAFNLSLKAFKTGIVRLEPGTTKNREAREFPFGEHPALKALLERQRASTDIVQRRQEKIIAAVFHRNGKPLRTFYKPWGEGVHGGRLSRPDPARPAPLCRPQSGALGCP